MQLMLDLDPLTIALPPPQHLLPAPPSEYSTAFPMQFYADFSRHSSARGASQTTPAGWPQELNEIFFMFRPKPTDKSPRAWAPARACVCVCCLCLFADFRNLLLFVLFIVFLQYSRLKGNVVRKIQWNISKVWLKTKSLRWRKKYGNRQRQRHKW